MRTSRAVRLGLGTVAIVFGCSRESPNGPGGSSATALTSGAAVTGLSGAEGSQQRFTISVASGASQLRVSLSGGTGDADLFVRRGGVATTSNYDCSSRGSSNAETCTIDSPAAGTWHATVYAYSAYSGASLSANVAGGGGGGGGGTGTGGGGTSNLPPFPVGTITCPNPPTQYFCSTRNGVTTPMTRVNTGVLAGVYHSATYKACIDLRSTGIVYYSYGNGYTGPWRTPPFGPLGYWGVPVASTGVMTGSADGRYVYVYTDHADPQLALMLYDRDLKTFVGFGFKREACPYSGITP